ncbi:hypothetical protein SAMN05421882_102836 [Nitrosomonas communis]|uniref:Uncharacterized protein n=1 Tax=Nitrosomonas communis TaxID=44574 RepID=A0A1H2WF34_9PROT|nr:hypothetical protein SAMN05421882_102836 [Nitrosomonas communis]
MTGGVVERLRFFDKRRQKGNFFFTGKILAPSPITGRLGCAMYAAIADETPSKLARPAY